ncbi:MAG: PspC domain-containing protein [Coriobacteriia bacterium]|nr:PspC domain-containing protein [Coriobacteriia bacterium]
MGPGFNKNTIVVLIGGFFILMGVWFLFSQVFGVALHMFWRTFTIILSILCSLTIIAGGVLLLVSARQKSTDQTPGKSKKLCRSTSNKKLGGVCGGIAAYLNIEPVIIRVVVVALCLISFYLIVPLYLILWMVMPPDSREFNTWV